MSVVAFSSPSHKTGIFICFLEMRLILSRSQINPLLNELMINRKLVFFEYVHFECLVSFFNLKFGVPTLSIHFHGKKTQLICQLL